MELIEFNKDAQVRRKPRKFNGCKHNRVFADYDTQLLECQDCKTVISPWKWLVDVFMQGMYDHERRLELRKEVVRLSSEVERLKQERSSLKSQVKRYKQGLVNQN